MDKRLLDHYNRELRFLQTSAVEFAKEFPGVAGHLALDRVPCPDPYVERLLEGCAFLTARVQTMIDAGFPRFTQSLLETIYPHFLSPTPSMAVASFTPDMRDRDLKRGHLIPRHTSLRTISQRASVPSCTYRTAHPVTLLPIEVAQARYLRREIATLEVENLPDPRAVAHVSLRAAPGVSFRPQPGAPAERPIDDLVFYVGGVDTLSMRMYEQLLANLSGVLVRVGRTPGARSAPGQTFELLEPSCVQRVGFSAAESMLPYDPRSFQGYRLLHEYFAFPQRFMFFRISGLAEAFSSWDRGDLELMFLFNKADPLLEAASREPAAIKEMFQLFCTPVVNLFPKRADHIFVSDAEYEYPLIADRARPLDFEIYSIDAVQGYSTRSSTERTFAPFYRAHDDSDETGAFYSTYRTARGVAEGELRNGRRTSYGGSDVTISLVDANAAPLQASLNRLAVETHCTNRDLPLFFESAREGESDFQCDEGLPATCIRCIAGPSKPWPSIAGGQTMWRLVSHLSLNYVSLLDAEDGSGAAGLREVMRLYSEWTESQVRADVVLREQIRRQVDSLIAVERAPITHRLPRPGPISFARGLELTVHFDEAGFEGSGPFLLGAVLEQFFARYVSINSFTQTVVRTTQRGELIRWPSTLGQRPIH